MLCLTRRINETVRIIDSRNGEVLGEVVLRPGYGVVRAILGFQFPDYIRIIREEVKDQSKGD